jgi:KDO2-lipid IV(A) lauroyltransferase
LVLFLALTVGSWIVVRIPKRVMYALAAATGSIAYVVAVRPRRNVQNNLAHVTGASPTSLTVRSAALRAFQNNAKNWCDTLRLVKTSREDIEKSLHVEGWEKIEAALGQGQGLILVGLHLGNIDIVGQIVAARGLKFTVPVETMKPPALFRRVQRLRQMFGIKTVPLSAGPRPLLAALHRNEVVGVMCDRNIGGSGVEIEFFGRPATVSKGPAWLAGLSNAPVLMGVGIRRPDNGFAGFVTGPLDIVRTGDRHADHLANAQTIMTTAESLIKRHPDQWLMFAEVWQPTSVADIREFAESAESVGG